MPVITPIIAASSDDSFEGATGANSPGVTPLNVRSSASDYRTAALRFQLTGVNQGDTINDAYLEAWFTHTARDDIHVDVIAEAVDNGAAFTSASNHITGRISAGVTTASFEWNQTGSGVGYYSTGAGSLTAVVQEIVNRPGWVSGNYIVIFLDPRAYTDGKFGWIEAFEAGTGNYPKLTVDYSGGATPVTVAVNPATLTLTPQAVTPTPGTLPPVTIAVNPATLNLLPQATTPAPGTPPVTVAVNPATLSLLPQAVTPVTGTPPVTIAVNPATLSLLPQTVTPAPGTPPVTVAVNPAILSLLPQAVTPTPGNTPVTVTVNPATLNLTPQAVTPVAGLTPITVAVNPATLTLWEQPVAIVRGTPAGTPVTVQVNPATLRPIGQPVNVTAPGDALLIGESSPLSLSATTPNNLEHGLGTHTHAIEASAAPGVSESLLKTDVLGELHLASFQADEINNHLIPRATDTFDLGSSTRLWRHGWLSELDTVLFAENTVTLLGGWFVVSKDAGTLPADVDGTQTTIDFGKTMTPNDFVIMRASLAVEYVQIGTLVSGTTYNVTRDVDGSGANTWPAGQPFMVLGNTGDGRIELNAYDTPRIQILEQGATYNAQTEIARLGDLNGNWGYSGEQHGIALGEYAASKSNLTWDPTNGLRLRTYDLTVLQLDNAGNASIEGFLSIGASGGIYQGTGTPASPTTGIKLWNDGGIGRLAGYNGGTLQAEFASDGKIKAGAGAVVLDENGLTLPNHTTTTWDGLKSFKFKSGSTTYARTWLYTSPAVDRSQFIHEAISPNGANTASVTIYAGNGTNEAYISLNSEFIAPAIDVNGPGGSPGDGNIRYAGNLKSYKNSTSYDVYGYHPLTAVLTSTNWNGDAKAASTYYTLTLSEFGVPTGAKAVSVNVVYQSSTTGYVRLGPSTSNPETTGFEAGAGWHRFSGIVPVSTSNNFVYHATATVSQIWLTITGYWI